MGLPLTGSARATVVVLGWIAAAVVAGFIGVTAIGAVGDGIVGSSTTPLSAEQVDQQLAAQATTTTIASSSASTPPNTPATSAPGGTSTQPPPTQPPPTQPPPTQPPAQGQTKVFSTDGGSVVARCDGASPQIVSATGAQGFTVKKEADEGEGRARVEFESDSQDLKVRVEITCSGGVPTASIEED